MANGLTSKSSEILFDVRSTETGTLAIKTATVESSSNDANRSSNDNEGIKLIGAIVAVFLLIVTIIVCTVVIVGILNITRRKKGSEDYPTVIAKPKKSLDNPTYQGENTNTCMHGHSFHEQNVVLKQIRVFFCFIIVVECKHAAELCMLISPIILSLCCKNNYINTQACKLVAITDA